MLWIIAPHLMSPNPIPNHQEVEVEAEAGVVMSFIKITPQFKAQTHLLGNLNKVILPRNRIQLHKLILTVRTVTQDLNRKRKNVPIVKCGDIHGVIAEIAQRNSPIQLTPAQRIVQLKIILVIIS